MFIALYCVLLLDVMRSVTAGPAAPDAAEGKWLGSVGPPDNRAVLCLDVQHDSLGKLSATFCVDQINYYGAAVSDFKATSDGRYTATSPYLELKLSGDGLVGTMGQLSRYPVELHRAERLPTDPPVPKDVSIGPGPRWQTKLGSAIFAAAALRDGMAYVGTIGGVFHAVNVKDGTLVWTFSAGRAMFGEPLATADAVYFTCDNGWLFKLNRVTGKELWRYDLGDSRVDRVLPHPAVFDFDHESPQPVLADGVLFVGAGDGGFQAVEATSGQRIWRIQSKGKIRTTASVVGPNVVFTTLDGVVCMVERASGKTVWSIDRKFPVTSSPVVIGDNLIVGDRGSTLAALKPATGEILWQYRLWGSWVESTAVGFSDGFAYVGSSDLRRVTRFDPKDGRIAWRTDVFGSPWGRPVVTNKFVYEGTEAVVPYSIRHVGSLVALDRESGKLAWRWPLPNPEGVYNYGFAASPALAGNILVIGGIDGTLYGFPVDN